MNEETETVIKSLLTRKCSRSDELRAEFYKTLYCQPFLKYETIKQKKPNNNRGVLPNTL